MCPKLLFFLRVLCLLLLCLDTNLIGYLWLSLIASVYIISGSSVVLILFLTPLALNHLYGQTSNVILMSVTKPVYASLLMLVVSQQLSVLLAVLVAFKCLPEAGLQWFTMGGLYYIFFRSSSIIFATILAFLYLRRLSGMNFLVLVLGLPLTIQGLVKAVIRSSRPGRLAVWIFLSMFILFIFNSLTLDRSSLPSRVMEARIMRGAAIV